jgi:enediyne biosynthesis protein E4
VYKINCLVAMVPLKSTRIHHWAHSIVAVTITVAVFGTPVADRRPRFSDESVKSGIEFRADGSPTSRKYLLETMVGGVAVLDYDGDGRLDVFFVNGAKLDDPMQPSAQPDKSNEKFWNRLYRNQGDGTFVDTTAKADVAGHSFGMGAAVGDYDNDGNPDVYVTNYGQNILYRNDGKGKFIDVTKRAGVGGGGWSAGAAFVDVDNDGKLDIFVARYLKWGFKDIWCGDKKPGYRAYCHPKHFDPISHILYKNNGDGTFSDISQSSGLVAHPGKGLGVAIEDYDRDGLIDVLVANDSFPQQLFHNLGDGKFEEVGLSLGLAYDDDGQMFAGMGVDFADYDNDGFPDAFVNALSNQRYALFKQIEKNFEHVSGPTGVGRASALHSGWGARLIDYDNDGWKDLFVAQGHVMDNIELTQPALRYREPLLLLRNDRGRFVDVSTESGEPFRVPRAARGAAFGDLDGNGYVDVLVSCLGENAVLLKNGGAGNHWLVVNTVGTRSNRDGIGARIRLVSHSGVEQHRLVSTAGSYLSSSDKRVHFGLGPDRHVKLLEIVWPSVTVQRLSYIKADQILSVREPETANAR